MKQIFVGIDPGKSGALAMIDAESGIAFAIPYDPKKYIDELRFLDPAKTIVCLESVHAMPKQGVTSQFTFGTNFGWLQGVLDTLHIPYELVHPKKWKLEFSVTADKNSAIEVCKRLYPDVSLLPSPRCKKDNDGMAEALLMAEYARRRMA